MTDYRTRLDAFSAGQGFLDIYYLPEADEKASLLEDLRSLLSEAAAQAVELERMREALEIIAGKRQCIDNLMGNADLARQALQAG